MAAQWKALAARVAELERRIVLWHRADETSRRLATVPGIGPITASALVASVSDARAFATGRHFAAWLGLTPREWSSAMKRRQGAISKRGDGYLRRLLILASHAVMRQRGRAGAPPAPEDQESWSWLAALRARQPTPVAAVVLADKTARIAWAIMAHGRTYQDRPVV